MWVLYIILCILQPICLPVPETTTILFGSIYIGTFQSYVLGLIGTIMGISIMYWLVKHFKKVFLKRKSVQKKLEQFQRYTRNYSVLITGMLFVVPVLPDEIVCIGAVAIGIEYPVLFVVALFSKMVSIGLVAYSAEISNSLCVNQYMVIIIEVTVLLIISVIFRYRHKGES